METENARISELAVEGDQEMRMDVFVRQVDDRALPAPQVLAEQQEVLNNRISAPLFIP